MENMPRKFIDFIITQKCTYRCEYCSQSKNENCVQNEADDNTICAFLNFLKNLDKDFEIMITGGEAILHKNFFDLIEKIKKLGFKINLISNFSFDIDKYLKIFKILDDSLNVFDLSFHLDMIKDFDKELEKLEIFLKNKPKKCEVTVFIPIFKLNSEKESRINKLIEIVKKYNINYEYQKIRFLDRYISNNLTKEQEEKYFKDFHPVKSFSNICCAGKDSAVIYEDGSVYRCYSSRFLKTNYLGNIKNKNFKLNNNPKPCVLKSCTCPKPVKYNQILSQKNRLKAYKDLFINGIFLPYFLFKKANILKIKLKQLIKF